MSTVEEIEAAINELPKEEAFALAERLQQRMEKEWDQQFDSDVKAGRLDKVAEKALQEYRAGETKDFPDDEE